MPTRCRFALLLLALSFTPSASLAAGKGLAGLDSLNVVIEVLSEDATNHGLTEADLLSDATLKLRLAGIVVTEDVNPYLYVRVNVILLSLGREHIYGITVQLNQQVTTKRGTTVYGASTWESGSIGLIQKERMPRTIRGKVKDEMDRFLNAYLAENPRNR